MKNRTRQQLTDHFIKSLKGRVVLFCLLILFISAQQAFGVSCHCFRDRTFEPSQPASADPYILATARNSLLAAASGVDKGAVVRQRMTGATETDLWLSRYLSTRVNRSADELFRARDSSSSWSGALGTLELDTGKLGPDFQTAREQGNAEGMARALADPVLGGTFNTGKPTLDRLRDAGTNISETTLSLYLSGRMNRTPENIWKEVKEGKQTWGSLFDSLNIRIDTVGDLIAEAVKKSMK